jgi:hypothetical protein
MDWGSAMTGVVIGVLTGGVTGYLGVLFAFKQFRKQLAFDRQLDWYETTERGFRVSLSLDLAANLLGSVQRTR